MNAKRHAGAVERRVGRLARIRGFALCFCSFLCSFLDTNKDRHYFAFAVVVYFIFDWLHGINPAIMSLVAVISATIAMIAAHIAQRKALRAMRLASSAIASVRSSRESRSSSLLFNSLHADLLASGSTSPIPARSLNSSDGIFDGKKGSSSSI